MPSALLPALLPSSGCFQGFYHPFCIAQQKITSFDQLALLYLMDPKMLSWLWGHTAASRWTAVTSTHRSLRAELLISQSVPVWHLLHPRCRTQHFYLLNFMPLLITLRSSSILFSGSRKKKKGKRCFYCFSLHSLLTDLWAHQYSLKRWSAGNIQEAARQELLIEGECIQPHGTRYAQGFWKSKPVCLWG